jgi:hypothetical protein
MSARAPSAAGLVGLVALCLLPAAAAAEPDPGTATTISAVSTLVPCALGAAAFTSDSPELGWALTTTGVYLGPATGYLYGRRGGRGLVGVGVRVGLSVAGVSVAGVAFGHEENWGGAAVVALVFASSVVAVSVADVVLVGGDVRRHNERRAVGVVPWRSREGATGLALRATF